MIVTAAGAFGGLQLKSQPPIQLWQTILRCDLRARRGNHPYEVPLTSSPARQPLTSPRQVAQCRPLACSRRLLASVPADYSGAENRAATVINIHVLVLRPAPFAAVGNGTADRIRVAGPVLHAGLNLPVIYS